VEEFMAIKELRLIAAIKMVLFANRLLDTSKKKKSNLLPTGPLRIDKGLPLELKE
jgi:6,7-dimethyl-8-ribityllumazine synthase